MRFLTKYDLIMMERFEEIQYILADYESRCDWCSELEYTEELAERKQRFAHRSHSHQTITKPRP